MDQFKAIESDRMSMKHAKRKKEMGGKIDPGRARLGKKNGPTCTIYIPVMASRSFFVFFIFFPRGGALVEKSTNFYFEPFPNKQDDVASQSY